MSKTDYLENKLLEHQVGKAAYAMPTAYVALFTAAPSDAGGGTEVSTSGTGYARKATAGADWNAASGGSISNAVELAFPTATGSYTVTHFAIFDAASGGNMLRWGALSEPRPFVSGDTPRFLAGQLVLTED